MQRRNFSFFSRRKNRVQAKKSELPHWRSVSEPNQTQTAEI
jgi:hypothetical protein